METTLETGVPDLRDTPLGELTGVEAILARVLGEDRRVEVAAFNSSV
ncbi:FXSXX-COOH protein [Planomonospora sp. ID67723]|nr:FxSxx-COOH cyclophane-containing RiPP peptide [Planomonospora sp. ID67723]MBG0828576.1 FXSXX-COOH protein [Planomonospora sp. ID67723]